jgi:Trk K+ transport system NAD-binding subunit
VLAQADLDSAAGIVAGTDNDTTNLSLVAAARRANRSIFVAARQNASASAPLFAAMQIDALLVPSEVIAHEVYAQLSTPLLWRFLREMPARGDAWAAELIDQLIEQCGDELDALWKLPLTREAASAAQRWLGGGHARVGDVLRNPEEREDRLHALVLLVLRGREAVLAPDDDFLLAPGDELLLAGRPAARRALATTLVVDSVLEYVVTGRRVPSSWIWRTLTRQRELETAGKQ